MVIISKPSPRPQNHNHPNHKKHTINNQRRQIPRRRAIIKRKTRRDPSTIRRPSHQPHNGRPRTLNRHVIRMPTVKQRRRRKRPTTQQEAAEIRYSLVLLGIDCDEDYVPDEGCR